MLKSISIKFLAATLGSLLLIRLLVISTGIPFSILTRPAPTTEFHKKILQANPRHAYSSERLAKHELRQKNYAEAKKNALTTLANNPSSGMAMATLISVYEQQDKPERAHQAAQLSAQLWPAHDRSMKLVSDYWTKIGNAGKAMAAWNVILSQNPTNADHPSNWATRKIFPILHSISLHEDSSQLFQHYHANPPSWWDAFFQYQTEQKNNFEAVDRFYQQTLLNNNKSEKNRERYLSYLMQESRWENAYSAWLSGQNNEARQSAKLIFDGGFEGAVFNDEFSWNITKKNHVQAYLDKFSRSNGSHSLRVAFNTWVNEYHRHIRQLLVLKPGEYTLEFQTRANLNAEKGVKWVLDCVHNPDFTNEANRVKLGGSNMLSGSFPWHKERIDFTVPNDSSCKAQILYLILAGSNPIEKRVRGDIWFDDFKIRLNQE